ncbi:LysR substrate-binding domain-containing protein [Azospirillum sp.]|uniref:LysR substrate-binding domain-containing protein n=1 Tax=Azospirillum sp. TaxID=34012 RepID=UPI002D74A652|nr:LysR substrate-binding domain-containing protein [Azospirillum sp.]HYD71189.1 LysR substrate-binding domain-containing protein [Azospirillum sp.]
MKAVSWTQRVRLQQLRVVTAVKEHGSLLKAAETLGLTQPAVSKALKEIEAELGVTLFRRTNRGVEATPYGEAMLHHIRQMFSQLEQAADEVAGLKQGVGGRVAVGTLISASARLLPRAIALMRRDRPRIVTTVLEGTWDLLAPALLRGDLDLTVGRLPEFQHREGLELEPFYEEMVAFVVRASHPLAERPRPSPMELLEWPWLLPPRETTLRRLIDRAFRDAGCEPPIPSCESLSQLTNRRLLQETDIIGVWPERVARDDIDSGLLKRLDVPLIVSFGPVGIARRRGTTPSPAAAALIEALRLTAAQEGGPAAPPRGVSGEDP